MGLLPVFIRAGIAEFQDHGLQLAAGSTQYRPGITREGQYFSFSLIFQLYR